MSTEHTLSFTAITLEDAEPRAAQTLKQAKARIGSIPNIYGLMANAPGLLETYTTGDKLFRQTSHFTPAEREVVYLSISRFNECRYCVAVHSTLGDTMSRVPRQVTDAIRRGTAIDHPKFSALNTFTTVMVDTRARPAPGDLEAFLEAGYTQRNVLDIVHAIAVKTLTNYANNFFDTPLDPPFTGRRW